MKKLFLILFISTIAYGQAGNPIIDSLNAHSDSLHVHRIALNSLLSLSGGTISGNVIIEDSDKLYLGTGSDYAVYYDGSSAYFYGAGNVNIGTSNAYEILFKTNATSRWYINSSGHFLPYATSTYDIGSSSKIVKNIYADTLTVSERVLLDDGDRVILGTDSDFSLYHSGSYAWLYNSTGAMYLRNVASAKISFYTNDTERWYVGTGGHFTPFIDGTYDIGTSASRVRNIHTDTVTIGSTDVGATLATMSTTTAVKGFISDSLNARTLDPIVFAIGYPQTGDVIGPFRLPLDVTLGDRFLYLEGEAGEVVTYNVFYHTSVNTSAVAGSGSETPFFTSNESGTPTTGTEVDSDDSNIYEATPDAGEWIWCQIISVTGSPDRFSLTINKSVR